MAKRHLDTKQKVALFRRHFTGLAEVYGSYDPTTGNAFQVKDRVTDTILLAHLQGKRPYGVYLLTGDRTRALAIDFDDGGEDLPLQFHRRALSLRIPTYIERSKSKGYHVWIFCGPVPVLAGKARAFAKSILDDMGVPATEVFPKQDRLSGATNYGNFINAPLFGALVPKGRTVFVDPGNRLEPFPDQWDVLSTAHLVTEAELDQGTALQRNRKQADGCGSPAPAAPAGRSRSMQTRRTLACTALPICAQRMLNEGATENQRVSCFRLAIHFNRLGVPFDIAVAALKTWALKNRPSDGKAIITPTEVERQADCAYKKAYRGFGCTSEAVRPFCEPECPIYRSGGGAR